MWTAFSIIGSLIDWDLVQLNWVVTLFTHEPTELRNVFCSFLFLNSSFRSLARHLSEDLRDSPLLGTEQILYWVEHIARHGGRVHHRSSSHSSSSIWNLYHVDVIGVLVVLALLGASFLGLTSFYAFRKIWKDFISASGAGTKKGEAKSEWHKGRFCS